MVSLAKAGQRYLVRYRAGQESDVITALALMAGDPEQDFDLFDAARLSYLVGRRLRDE